MRDHRSTEDLHNLFSQQVLLQYQQLPPGLIATIIISGFFVAGLWPSVSSPLLLGWYAMLSLVTLYRYLVYRSFKWRKPPAAEIGIWHKRFLYGAIATALCWSTAGTLLFPDDTVHQMLVILVLAGFSASAIAFLAYIYHVYLVYLLFTMAPLTIMVFIQPGEVYQYIGAMLLVFFGVAAATAKRFQHAVLDSLQLQFEKEGLIAGLEKSARQLEQANGKLLGEVGERERTEQELRKINLFQKTIMESTTNAIFVLDEQGNFMQSNQVISEITGYPVSHLLGRPFRTIVQEDRREGLDRCFTASLASDELQNCDELPLHLQDGSQRIISLSFTRLIQSSGLPAVVGTAEDITERNKAEMLKNQFVSVVSHELRTPLTSIVGSLALVTGGVVGEMPAKALEMIQLARRNCDKLLRLINELLDMKSLEAGELTLDLQVYPLAPLLRQSVEVNQGYSSQFHVALIIEAVPDDICITVDAQRFEQILSNLISNAVKFSPTNATVTVSAIVQDKCVRIRVADCGPGIEAMDKERIFEPFAQADSSDQRKVSGTGLGLTIAKSLVEHMGGGIGLSCPSSGGTVFHVDLPIAICI